MGKKKPQRPAKKRWASLHVQHGGSHYKDMVIEPAEFIMLNNIPWAEGSAIKYLSRHRKKAREEDVKKAIHFCQMVMEREYGISVKVEYGKPALRPRRR